MCHGIVSFPATGRAVLAGLLRDRVRGEAGLLRGLVVGKAGWRAGLHRRSGEADSAGKVGIVEGQCLRTLLGHATPPGEPLPQAGEGSMAQLSPVWRGGAEAVALAQLSRFDSVRGGK
jgi:hypothetical protein